MLSHRSLENASSEPSTPASSPLRIVEDGDADRAEEVGIHRLAERRALDCRSHTLRPVADIHSQPPPSSRRGRSPRCRVLRYRERPLSTTPKHLGSFWKDASQRHVARGWLVACRCIQVALAQRYGYMQHPSGSDIEFTTVLSPSRGAPAVREAHGEQPDIIDRIVSRVHARQRRSASPRLGPFTRRVS